MCFSLAATHPRLVILLPDLENYLPIISHDVLFSQQNLAIRFFLTTSHIRENNSTVRENELGESTATLTYNKNFVVLDNRKINKRKHLPNKIRNNKKITQENETETCQNKQRS